MLAGNKLKDLQMTGRFDKTLLEFLPPSIKYICHIGAGYESIDVPSCAERGMPMGKLGNMFSDFRRNQGLQHSGSQSPIYS